MKRILAQTAGACILLSGAIGNAYSATGDTTVINVNINVKARTCQFDKTESSYTLATVRVEDFIHTSQIVAVREVPVSINCSDNVDTVPSTLTIDAKAGTEVRQNIPMDIRTTGDWPIGLGAKLKYVFRPAESDGIDVTFDNNKQEIESRDSVVLVVSAGKSAAGGAHGRVIDSTITCP